MKKIQIDGKEFKDFSKEQHEEKHTLRENTHCFDCPYCENYK